MQNALSNFRCWIRVWVCLLVLCCSGLNTWGTVTFVIVYPNQNNTDYSFWFWRDGVRYDQSAFSAGTQNSSSAVPYGGGSAFVRTNGAESGGGTSIYKMQWGLGSGSTGRTNFGGYARTTGVSSELLFFHVGNADCAGLTISRQVCFQNFFASAHWYLVYTNGVEYIPAGGHSREGAIKVEPGRTVCGNITLPACFDGTVTAVPFPTDPHVDVESLGDPPLPLNQDQPPLNATNQPNIQYPDSPLIYTPTNYGGTNVPIQYPNGGTNITDIDKGGFNAIYSALRDETKIRSQYDDRLLAALLDQTGQGLTGIFNLNITNNLTVTNVPNTNFPALDTNVIAGWYNRATISNDARSSMGSVDAKFDSLKSHGTMSSSTVESAPDMTVTIAGHDYDLNPFQLPIVTELAEFLRRLMAWIIRITYYILVVRLLVKAALAAGMVPQGRTPLSGGGGDFTGWVQALASVAAMALVAAIIIGFWVLLPALADDTLLAEGFLTDFSSTPFGSGSGNVQRVIYFIKMLFPLETFLVYLGSGFTARFTMTNTYLFVAGCIRRVPG